MNNSRYDLDKIEFKNEKKFLSNMYPAKIIIDYVIYPSAEHYYQSEKFTDGHIMNRIISAATGEKAKNIANKIAKEHPEKVKKDWDKIKIKTMRRAVREKFVQNKDIGQKLLLQEGYIEERNCWGDTFWGTVDGEGENRLGKIIMMTRNELLDMFGMPMIREDKNLTFIQRVISQDSFNKEYEKSIEDKYMYGECEALVSYLAEINDYKGEVIDIKTAPGSVVPGYHSLYAINDKIYDIRGKFNTVDEAIKEIDYFSSIDNTTIDRYPVKKEAMVLLIPDHLKDAKQISSTLDQEEEKEVLLKKI